VCTRYKKAALLASATTLLGVLGTVTYLEYSSGACVSCVQVEVLSLPMKAATPIRPRSDTDPHAYAFAARELESGTLIEYGDATFEVFKRKVDQLEIQITEKTEDKSKAYTKF
jgi:hypothetical protein